MIESTYIDPITGAAVTLETDTVADYVERETATLVDLIVDVTHHADPEGLAEVIDSFRAHGEKIGLKP